MSTLAEYMIVVGVENRPLMRDKIMYNSWQSHMLLYLKGKKNGRMMLESIENGPLVYPTIEENGQVRNKNYAELTKQEKLQDDCDVQELNIWHHVFRLPITNSEHLPIQETKLPFRMTGLLFNKFKEDMVKVLLVRKLREMLQVQRGNNAAGQERTDDLDAYDFDCEDISSAKAVLMANLSSYDSDVLSEYLQQTQNTIVQDTNSSAQQDAMILSVTEQISNQVTNYNKIDLENKHVNESLTAKLKTYKQRVKTFE
nr:hypothetical protein [Tanacetum cinerariifolium]